MNTRFKTLFGKPKTLSDRHHEISAEEAAELLRKPDAELGDDDFYVLFQVRAAAASYEEGIYYLPEAFAFLRRNPNEDGTECAEGVMWFISELFTRHPNYWEYLFRTLGLGCARTRFPFPTTYRADFCHEPEPAASARTQTAGTGQAIHLLTPRDQLIRDIEAAFHSVTLGDGFTLHEGPAFEGTDYCTAEERASVRACDPETCWQDIPDASLWECAELWGFDEEGVRYHLPAYMRWHVRNPPGPNAPRSDFLYYQLTFTHQEGKRVFQELGWDIYTREQKRVIARFLDFIVHEGGPFAQAARLAWQSYWHKFGQDAVTQ